MNFPDHVAIVMDGNGRWAKQRNLPRIIGHEQGVQSAKKVIELCLNNDIRALSLFAFGMDNWRRPNYEVDFLMKLFSRTLINEAKDLAAKNIQLRVIGDLNRLPRALQILINKTVNETAVNSGLILTLAISYSGRWDITQAVRKIAQRIEKNELRAADISEEVIAQKLMLADIPEPDLFIRTSGKRRISNFFLWQLSYSELYFTDVFWPDFDQIEFDRAIAHYQTRERRFGRISEQLVEVCS